MILDPGNHKFVSVASCWEIAIKAARKKLGLSEPSGILLSQELRTDAGKLLLARYGQLIELSASGQIAMRQSARSAEWQLFAGLKLAQVDGVSWISGGHVETPTPMSDVIETLSDQRFLLHGRMADMVNIAGKRNSLAYLNLQLAAIPGVLDGAYFMPDDSGADSVGRLTAFVVAPGLSPADVIAALRVRMDPVFLPRPLVFVDALPRNATGKLPREALTALARQRRGGEGA